MAKKLITKQEWQVAFEQVLTQPINEILKCHDSGLGMMKHIYPSDDFLKTLPWIEKHFGYKRKDEVTKGIVFVLGIATLNQHFINYLNTTEEVA